MTKLAFVSVAFNHQIYGDAYLLQQDRLKQSILDIYPDANLFFWRGELPPKSPEFFDSLYGFKVYAIEHAMKKGFERVVFFDPAMILKKKLSFLDGYTVISVKDENKLCQFVSDRYLLNKGFTRGELKTIGWHLVGGSFYYFDFSDLTARSVFLAWKQDEENGLFGTQEQEASGKLNGHRADETCMAYQLYVHNLSPVTPSEVGYLTNDPVMEKRHFK